MSAEADGIKAPTMNTFEFEETDRGRSLKARFTDASVASMSSTIHMLMGVRGRAIQQSPGPLTSPEVIDLPPHDLPPALPAEATVPDQVSASAGTGREAPPEVSVSGPPGSDDEKAQLHHIFRLVGETLILDEIRLKAKSQADFVRRLTYLFLYSHYLHGRPLVERGDLWTVLEDADVLDASNNAKSWVRDSAELRHDGDKVGLRAPGREQAKEILRQLTDATYIGTWVPGARVQSRGGKVASAADDDADGAAAPTRRKRGGGRTPLADKWVTAWRNLGLAANGHDAIKNRSSLDQGIFGLWAIRRASNDEVKVAGSESLSKFIFTAFEVEVSPQRLRTALSSAAAKDKVAVVGGASFQVNQTGMRYAEELAGLTNGAGPATADRQVATT